MLKGTSVLHVNQDLGRRFAVGEVKGYFNNLTDKVTMEPDILYDDRLPQIDVGNDKKVYFPVAIFQYGLGAYDLYLLKGENIYLKKFTQSLQWATEHQKKSGAWDNFSYIYPNNPYSAMAQGEGTSLLVRGYMNTGQKCYLKRAKLAIDFMLKPIEEGGTAFYEHEKLTLLEYTHLPAVMNGWIFAFIGLYDFLLASNCNNQRYSDLMEKTLNSLVMALPQFDNGYWSMYDLDGRIASPFYHRLHIAQMSALYLITGNPVFESYAKKWQDDTVHFSSRARSFMLKAWQKIRE